MSELYSFYISLFQTNVIIIHNTLLAANVNIPLAAAAELEGVSVHPAPSAERAQAGVYEGPERVPPAQLDPGVVPLGLEGHGVVVTCVRSAVAGLAGWEPGGLA